MLKNKEKLVTSSVAWEVDKAVTAVMSLVPPPGLKVWEA